MNGFIIFVSKYFRNRVIIALFAVENIITKIKIRHHEGINKEFRCDRAPHWSDHFSRADVQRDIDKCNPYDRFGCDYRRLPQSYCNQ